MSGNGTKCDTMLAMVLPHAFPGNLFITSLVTTLCLKDQQMGNDNPFRTISNGRGGSLEQVTWVLATQRQEKLC